MIHERRLLLYYITDRLSLGADEAQCSRRLLQKISEAARHGVDFIQLREKDLPARELEALAYEVAAAVKNSPRNASAPAGTRLLINSRVDIALASSADGVHLRSHDTSPRNVREIYLAAAQPRPAPIISVSCHAQAEVACAAREGADFALFAPVFGKQNLGKQNLERQNSSKHSAHAPAGLKALEEACRENVPVIALGGITLQNARDCTRAGAAGIAAIRLFQENDVEEIVRKLRDL
jgi:thiamine-phosphate pyrophosphorylase